MPEDIKEIFTAVANVKNDQNDRPPSIKDVRISPLLYQYLRNLHRDCVSFVEKLEDVMGDGEHQLLMSEGMQCGYRLPDAEKFIKHMGEFRDHLESYDPCDVRFIHAIDRIGHDADTVVVPGKIIRGFFETAIQSADFMNHFITALRGSQYFPWLRKLKENGVPYAGPTSVREFYVTFFSLAMAGAQTRQEALPPRMPPNWAKPMRNAA